MTELPTVGVALPVFNGAAYLEAALRSVLAQTHPILDIVVVDDGSDDDSASVARQVGGPVRVVRRLHRGIGAARSEAVRLVRGDVIVGLDADDLLTPRSVECRMDVVRARPDVDIVFGQSRTFRELDEGVPLPLDEPRPAVIPGAMLVRRRSYERVGPFATGLRVSEGLDWLLRAHEAGLVEVTVPAQVQWRRVHGTNNSLVHRDSLHEYARTLKASLDRRRSDQ